MDRIRARAGAGAFSPAIVFAVLLILVVTGAIFLTTRPEPPQPKAATSPQASPSPTTHRLTDAEAVTEFKRLEELSFRAFEQRNLSLLDEIYTKSSPILKKATADIRQLRRDQTQVAIRSRTTRVVVRKADLDQINLVQVAVLQTRFSPEGGAMLRTGGGRERQTIRWILRRVGDQWYVHDSVVVDAQPCTSRKC